MTKHAGPRSGVPRRVGSGVLPDTSDMTVLTDHLTTYHTSGNLTISHPTPMN